MALKQTLVVNNTLLLHPNPTPISPFRSLNPNTLRKLASASRIKCSFDYSGANNNNGIYEYERYAAAGPQYPRPSEIQWKKELCNSVQLIGVVGAPVQIKHLASGKVVGWSRLAVKKSQTDTIWINLTFWDELAHIASQHVEKGQQIHVSGRLVSDTVENDDGKQQTYYKVVVQHLNFIEKSPSPVPLYNGDSNSATPGKSQSSFSSNSTGSTEELWQAFFANPMEWWDNRKNKRSPNYPDFKHKDTGEALWVEGRYNPPWVKSQLAVLDSKMESFNEQSSSTHVSFMSADSLGSF
ncbi:protein OSB2, chloroplastic-like [Salvia miltiorrhiza]|uniref:protein OSB2, chloroplastic-like n=1 Tax=Salvia miltiorrhiza TaxID=226208 RepID=UPI0025AD6430|nr:protein OSB2, chloroplastic-like [Salvia miltiorrhiza]